MKIENNLFKIEIEKKHLSEEQKEERKLKRKKCWPAVAVALVLVVAIIGVTVYGHFYAPNQEKEQAEVLNSEEILLKDDAESNLTEDNGEEALKEDAADEEPVAEEWDDFELEEGEYVASSKLAASIQEKYGNESLYGYTYGDPIEGIGRTDSMSFQLGYDVKSLGLEYWSEIYALYEDPELNLKLGATYTYDEESQAYSNQSENTVAGKAAVPIISADGTHTGKHGDEVKRTVKISDAVRSSFGLLIAPVHADVSFASAARP